MHPRHPESKRDPLRARVRSYRSSAATFALAAALVATAGCIEGDNFGPPLADELVHDGSEDPSTPLADGEGNDPDSVALEDIGAEDCVDNIDNNGDGLVDCLDPQCDCVPEVCGDNVDNDGDGAMDCRDPQCGCVPEECLDGVDNDGDGLVDCLDPECGCAPEDCHDNVDNDLDGSMDCLDPECDCAPEVCFDNVDNDGDGMIDCGCPGGTCVVTPDPECPCEMFAEGCRSSERVAFLNCNSGATASVLPGDLSVDTYTCPQVLAAPHLLNGYDTIAYYGGGSTGWGVWGGSDGTVDYDINAMMTLLTQLYTAGAKVIVFANPDMSYLSVGDLSTHFHDNVVAGSTITVTSPNDMTDAFVQEEHASEHMVQLHSDVWCGDLFFQEGGVYDGHFHAYRMDTPTIRGLVVYFGLYPPDSDVVDFGEPFRAANLSQLWDPGFGTSDACGLTCERTVGHGNGKPVIYLYPEEEQLVQVRLDYEGALVTTYPEYDEELGGWDVIAQPDGTLTNVADGREYSYIYWNGVSGCFQPDFSTGFVVAGEDTVEFLQSTLSDMGLLPEEYNELIVYWLPYMEHHAYNLIHFAGEEYTSIARMHITPEPDSLLRVYMVFRELDEPVNVPEQPIVPFVREGFTVVEWGGSEIGGDWHVVR